MPCTVPTLPPQRNDVTGRFMEVGVTEVEDSRDSTIEVLEVYENYLKAACQMHKDALPLEMQFTFDSSEVIAHPNVTVDVARIYGCFEYLRVPGNQVPYGRDGVGRQIRDPSEPGRESDSQGADQNVTFTNQNEVTSVD